jgi:GxxExxY protein
MPKFVRSDRQSGRFQRYGGPVPSPLERAERRGFPGTGRLQTARSFALFSFLTRRKPEGHEAPRSVAMVRHRNLTEHIPWRSNIGLAIEVPRHAGSGLLESLRTAALCGELERACIRIRREAGTPMRCKGGGAARARLPRRYPADETVIQKTNAVPPLRRANELLQAHDMQLQSCSRITGLPAGLLLNFHAPSLKDSLRRFAG